MDTLSDLEAAFGFNPNLMRQGQRARVLAEKRDVNTLPDPLTYTALMGLMGVAPDEMGFSALHPKRQDVKRVAEPAFALGTALQVAPAVGALTKLMNATGSSGKVGASAAKQIGAIYRTLPPHLQKQADQLAKLARSEHPQASVEFATNADGSIIKGTRDAVSPSYAKDGVSLHTHGYGERLTPSNEDLLNWSSAPSQSALGIVRPDAKKGYSAFIVDPKGSKIPHPDEVDAQKLALFRKHPELAKKFEADDGLSRWKWFMDKANADDIDLYLHGADIPRELMYQGYKTPVSTLESLKQRGVGGVSSGELEYLMKYLSGGYEGINDALRGGEVPTSAYWIDDAMKRLSPLKEDLAVWRYGDQFPGSNRGYTSTTLDESFARKMASDPGIQVKKLIVPAGERAMDVSSVAPFPYEQEVLLPRGGFFSPVDESTMMFSSRPVKKARGGSVTAKDPLRLMAEKYAAHCPSLRNHALHKGN